MPDSKKAKEIAIRFIEQHHSTIDASAVLDEDTWTVMVRTGTIEKNTKFVRIDANTGKIIDYS